MNYLGCNILKDKNEVILVKVAELKSLPSSVLTFVISF